MIPSTRILRDSSPKIGAKPASLERRRAPIMVLARISPGPSPILDMAPDFKGSRKAWPARRARSSATLLGLCVSGRPGPASPRIAGLLDGALRLHSNQVNPHVLKENPLFVFGPDNICPQPAEMARNQVEMGCRRRRPSIIFDLLMVLRRDMGGQSASTDRRRRRQKPFVNRVARRRGAAPEDSSVLPSLVGRVLVARRGTGDLVGDHPTVA